MGRGGDGEREIDVDEQGWSRAQVEAAKRGEQTNAFHAVIAAVEQEQERLGDGGADPRDERTMYESEAIPEAAQKLWEAMGERQRQELFFEGVASYYRQAVGEDIA